MNSRKQWICLTLALTVALLGAAAAAAAGNPNEPDDRPVAEVEIQDGVIVWHPLIDEAIGLGISGPGVDYSLVFKGGETPYFKIVDDEGNLRPDGAYTFRLVAMPELDEPGVGNSNNGRKWELDPQELPKSYRQSGSFSVCEGYFVDPFKEEESAQATASPNKDQVILDDLIVDGSACIGFDCVNGEAFGFDTIRLKENNLRIKFMDTSAGSFPSNDWQITANDSANGGANKFSIDDIDGGRTPFTIEARAPSHSLYVDDGGRVGLGTSIPVADLHTVSGNTPTLRLEQDGSAGFAPQTWDVSGNETNFFVRDASNGSQLPFRIRPGAPTNSIYINTDGTVGLGTASPSDPLHVRRADGSAKLRVEENSDVPGTYTLMELETTGGAGINLRPRFTMTHGGLAAAWNFDILNNGNFAFIRNGGSVFTFTSGGDLQIEGDFVSNGNPLNVPDFVFADDYDLMPLDDVKSFIEAESHLPEVPSAAEINAGQFNLTKMQLTLLQKVEELTLYTLDQHDTIRDHQETIRSHQEIMRSQQAMIDTLLQRLEAVETAQN